jgi:hypothetical protein
MREPHSQLHGEFAERLNPSGRSFMAMLWFYCDESYDSKAKTAKTCVVSGFIAEKRIWERVKGLWDRVNKCRGVSRFHDSHLNAHDHEFTGWTPQRSKRYKKSLLSIITALME